MAEIQPTTEADLEIIAVQLRHVPRGVPGIVAHCNSTTLPSAAHTTPYPAIIATTPRLLNGEPSLTFYYLTCSAAVAACSQLEAADVIYKAETLLGDPQHLEFRLAYHRAHRAYLAACRVASPAPVPEIANFSANGMLGRVRCFHTLLGHALMAGSGVNLVGDQVLARLYAENLWLSEICGWYPEPQP